MTFLAILTFTMPPEIGERVTLVIESFFALCVIILMISESLPVTSDSTPLIAKFLLISMGEIGLALLANCISLNLYKKTQMPEWVRVIFLHYVARCLYMSVEHPTPDLKKREVPRAKLLDEMKLVGIKPLGPSMHGEMMPLGRNYFSQDRMAKFIEGIDEIAAHQVRAKEAERDREFWMFASRVLDRLFFILFGIAFITISTLIFMEVPDHYKL